MSRTIRRRNARYKAPINSDLEYEDPWWVDYLRKRYKCRPHQDLKKIVLNDFHSDCPPGRYTVPAFFCQIRKRKVKRRNSQLLYSATRFDEWDCVTFHPFIRDAGWSWW